MDDDDILIGTVIETAWLTLEQLAAACRVKQAWLVRHLEADLFPDAERIADTWRLPFASLQRTQRMRQLERDFDAVPELAALVADMQETLDALRTRLREAGLE